MIYLTADLHLGHENIIKYCNRPFVDVDEMDNTLINNWNRTVHQDDIVYVLGDFSLLRPIQKVLSYIERLNGRVYFLQGSHDAWLDGIKVNDDITNRSSYIGPLVQIKGIQSDKYNLPTTLCHYAMRKWDRGHYGAAHFYGHSHGKLDVLGRSLDVGIDSWEYYPVNYELLLAIVSSIKPHDSVEPEDRTP